MIAWFGNCVLYSFYEYQTNPVQTKIDNFEKVDIHFSDSTEIVRILDTAYPNIYQIIAKDNELNVFIVLTWDFKRNLEVHQIQSRMLFNNKDFSIRVFKGTIHKMNYFMDNVQVTDLSSNTPYIYIPVKNEVSEIKKMLKQNNIGLNYFENQKKMFTNNTIFLDTDQPSLINLGYNRMDIEFWENMERKGPTQKLFEANVSLHKFSKFYGGKSLFHYFIGDSELIKVIRDKYLMAKNHGNLSNLVERLPLNAICPDYEMHSALYHCIEMENLKSFEYIIDMVTDFPDICLTNQMIRFIPLMVNRQSESFLNFFHKNSFKTLSMDKTLLINWNNNIGEEFVFLSNSSIISQERIEKEMREAGLLSNREKQKSDMKQNESHKHNEMSQFELRNKVFKICKEAALSQISKQQTERMMDQIHNMAEEFQLQDDKQEKLRNEVKSVIMQPDKYDFYTLNQSAEEHNEHEVQKDELTRVNVEALEFDWVFTEDNAENLITVLAQVKNTEVLTKKPIKMFVDFMWSYYQRAIIIWIFIPYLIYMVTFLYLTSGVISNVVERDANDPESIEHWHHLCLTPALLTSLSTAFFIFFAKQEIFQILDKSISDYYSDIWNWIDSLTLMLNFLFLLTITITQVSERFIIDEFAIRRMGSFASFFMWIKVFYWMRLFEPLAKYVSLIITTIMDCLWFIALVFIIILSFTTFFYITNMNLEDESGGQDTYIPKYTTSDYQLLNAFLEVYFMCIGMYDVTVFGRGSDEYFVWLMFVMATFINLIVFMNMLIAIMAKTFTDVMENEHESSIQEKVQLISDHIFIVDYSRIFKNKKYLIKVSQINSEFSQSLDIQDYLRVLQSNINRKFDQLNHTQNQKLVRQDNISRSFYKIQQETKNEITLILKYIRAQQSQDKKNKNLTVDNLQEIESNLKTSLKNKNIHVMRRAKTGMPKRQSKQSSQIEDNKESSASSDDFDRDNVNNNDYQDEYKVKHQQSCDNILNKQQRSDIRMFQRKTNQINSNQLAENQEIPNQKISIIEPYNVINSSNTGQSQSKEDINDLAKLPQMLNRDIEMKKQVQKMILNNRKINKISSKNQSMLNEQSEMIIVDQQKDSQSLPRQQTKMKDGLKEYEAVLKSDFNRQINIENFRKLSTKLSQRRAKTQIKKTKSEQDIKRDHNTSPYTGKKKQESKTSAKELINKESQSSIKKLKNNLLNQQTSAKELINKESQSSIKKFKSNLLNQQSAKTVKFEKKEELKQNENSKKRTKSNDEKSNKISEDSKQERHKTPQINKSKGLEPTEQKESVLAKLTQSFTQKRKPTLMNQINKNLFEDFNRAQGKGQQNKPQNLNIDRKYKTERK